MARQRANGGNPPDSKRSKGIAIAVGNGLHGEGLFHVGKERRRSKDKKKAAVLMKAKERIRKKLRLVDVFRARLETHAMTGSGEHLSHDGQTTRLELLF